MSLRRGIPREFDQGTKSSKPEFQASGDSEGASGGCVTERRAKKTAKPEHPHGTVPEAGAERKDGAADEQTVRCAPGSGRFPRDPAQRRCLPCQLDKSAPAANSSTTKLKRTKEKPKASSSLPHRNKRARNKTLWIKANRALGKRVKRLNS